MIVDAIYGLGCGLLVGVAFLLWDLTFGSSDQRRWARKSEEYRKQN